MVTSLFDQETQMTPHLFLSLLKHDSVQMSMGGFSSQVLSNSHLCPRGNRQTSLLHASIRRLYSNIDAYIHHVTNVGIAPLSLVAKLSLSESCIG